MNIKTFENYSHAGTTYYLVQFDFMPIENKLNILLAAFRFNGNYVGHTATFKTPNDREKYLTWITIKYGV